MTTIEAKRTYIVRVKSAVYAKAGSHRYAALFRQAACAGEDFRDKTIYTHNEYFNIQDRLIKYLINRKYGIAAMKGDKTNG